MVVELFTSQGCNSCPPADELLGELSARADLLPLAFHVTYWDRLGWPDTLGLPTGTERQYRYASLFGSGRVYTPQMVVGGRLDVVGSDRARVLQAIKLIADHAPDGPMLAIAGSRLTIGAGADQAKVWLAGYDHKHEVAIERGENRGRTIAYHHAVRELVELGQWSGQPLELELPLEQLREAGRDGAAVLLQRISDGAMLAAARVQLARDPKG